MKYTREMENWKSELIAMLMARYNGNADEDVKQCIESDLNFAYDAAYSQGVNDGMLRISKILDNE